jgi:hypothetical protein
MARLIGRTMFPFVSAGSIVRNFVRAGLAPAELKHQRVRRERDDARAGESNINLTRSKPV